MTPTAQKVGDELHLNQEARDHLWTIAADLCDAADDSAPIARRLLDDLGWDGDERRESWSINVGAIPQLLPLLRHERSTYVAALENRATTARGMSESAAADLVDGYLETLRALDCILDAAWPRDG